MASLFLRPAETDDEPFLWTMLYEASHAAEQGTPTPDDLRAVPELARYVEKWGTKGDLGVVGGASAEQLQGAAWIRLFDKENAGYGYVADDIPELAIATSPAARGTGLGTALLARLLDDTHTRYDGMSLSVRADNPARRLYTRLGFVEVAGSEIINRAGTTSLAMLLRFR
ncbi:GNAT family N-acetyltransferase [Nocardia sp. NBC_01009]|uniref:GNAT family N-acetyltransferase n=1 Tax=Nocardia sp. NBC_01009 TaxID=2975996 RepID=UPI00386E8494|nr:GNAT family N-acetyltransferase [Nocardia sp. NBC_01009]